MINAYKLGGVFAVLIAGYLGFIFNLWFYNNPQFFLPQLNDFFCTTDWMVQFHSFSMAVVFSIALIVTASYTYIYVDDYYGTKVNAEVLKIIVGLIHTLFFAVFAWFVVYLVNATGIAVGFTWIFKTIANFF